MKILKIRILKIRFAIKKQKKIVSKKIIREIIENNINFNKILINLRIVVNILQKIDFFSQKKRVFISHAIKQQKKKYSKKNEV